MILQFTVINQTLRRIDHQDVIADSANYLYASFKLPSEYDGELSALFTVAVDNENRDISMSIIDGICQVPNDVIKPPRFTVTLTCSWPDKFISTNAVPVEVYCCGVPKTLRALPDGQPNEFADFKRLHSEVKEMSTEVDLVAHSVNESLGQAKFIEENCLASEYICISRTETVLEKAEQVESDAIQTRENKIIAVQSALTSTEKSLIASQSAQSALNSAESAYQSMLSAKQSADKIDLTDKTTGKSYKIAIDNGRLILEVV